MSTNRDLFKEAIADAKAVKTMAIESAKAALEESFTPHLTKMFSAKLHELESEELKETENVKVNEEETLELEENEVTNEEIDLDEILAELEGEESTDDLNEAKDDESEDKEESEEEEGEFSIEDMSEEDLKNLVADVIKDMTASGEIEAGHEGAEESEEGEGNEENEEGEEEVNLDEILNELGLSEDHAYKTKVKDFAKGSNDEHVTDQTEEDDEPYSKEKAAKISFEEQLNEALSTIKTLQEEIKETNLLNAKLLYTNKIFKSKNLTESMKVKVLNSFDKAKTVDESKVVYETILESLKDKKTFKPINENLGRASKATGKPVTKEQQPILEVNSNFLRMQKLAGL